MGNLFRFFLFGMLAVIVIVPIHAFASSSTGAPAGGEGAGIISGWDVSNISYQSSSDPSRVTSVEFDLNSPAQNVSVKLVSGDSTYFQCANIYAYHWQCDLAGGMEISSMDEVRVVASNK
jgi:hypothetical protein